MRRNNTNDPQIQTITQKEALINEYKGNLFEYLIGSQLARFYRIEKDFISSFDGTMKVKFLEYEKWLRLHDPVIIKQLPVLATKVSNTLLSRLPKNIEQIYVTGKMRTAQKGVGLNEADLMLLEPGKSKKILISIKLCKNNSFVNTKSGGIKSFLINYFPYFSSINNIQEQLNFKLERSFLQMGQELYHRAGLQFVGGFDDDWNISGHSNLPGQLTKEMKSIVQNFYFQVINELYDVINQICSKDPINFQKALFPILGIGNRDIIQVCCFYDNFRKNGKQSKYLLKKIHIMDYQTMLDELGQVALGPMNKDRSSFEIYLKNIVLQIRVKPMNKFTVPALKVNCSIKYNEVKKGDLDYSHPL